MPFEAYLPQGFQHNHENRMFHELATSLKSAFSSSSISAILIGNACFTDKELDAVLLMPDALFVIEMKDYGGLIHFSENVEWFADEDEVVGGSHRNPYWQIRANKFGLLNHLQRKAPDVLNRGTSNYWWHVCGVVLFGRGIQFDEKLPKAISDWFSICDQQSVVGAVSSFRSPRWVSPRFSYRPLTATELGRIVGGLGLTSRHLYTGCAVAVTNGAVSPPPEIQPLKVTPDNPTQFRIAVLRLRQAGGRKTAGAMTLLNLIQEARSGIDSFSSIQSVPEPRIENAIIYHLNEEARCVAVKVGSVVRLCHCGTPQEVGLWIQANAGKTFTVDAGSLRTESTVVTTDSSQAVLAPTHLTEANTPFLARVSGLELQKLVPSEFVRKHLLRLNENSSDEDIRELLGAITDEDVQLFLHDVISLAKAGDIAGAETRVRLRNGDACPIVDAPEMAEAALAAEANSDQIVVLNDLSQDEFDRFFDPLRFREWMTFLHPGQKRVANEDFAGPALLTGVSGSGKTCVLVHRAQRLAQFFDKDRILILTLNQSLARLIEILVGDLCLGDEKGRIEVKAFHEYLSDVLSSLDCEAFLRSLAEFTGMREEVEAFLEKSPPADRTKMFRPLTEREQMIAFDEFLAEPSNPAKVEFDRLEIFVFSQDQTIDLRRYLFEELELVRSAFTCYDGYKGYTETAAADSSELAYKREGRSVGFQENRRQAILGILREWEKFQLRRGFFDLMGLAQAAVFAVDDRGNIPDKFRYRSVLVDEFQDLSTLELSLLRQIPRFTENGLFLTGDFAQKIYAKDLNLPAAQLGRDVRTDRIIRRNYRNSRQVLLAAQALLEAYPPQIAGGEGDVAVLKPEYASKESAAPIATQASDPIRAAWDYAEQWVRGGHKGFSVCIATANDSCISTEAILRQKPSGLIADELSGDYLIKEKTDSVVVAEISTVKGFEFTLIIVCGLDDGVFPPKGVPVAEHWREAMRLYVAITRGRDEVRFIYENAPSLFLTAMGEKIQFQTWEAPPLPELVVEPVAEPVVEQVAKTIPPPEPHVVDQEVTLVSAPIEVKGPTATTSDPLTTFFDQHQPEVLNGILVVPIPADANQWQLARALGHDQTAVSIACQGLGYFTAPNRPLSRHIILGVCAYFRCVANIIPFNQSTRYP